ncbi:MAG: hypothetical protein JW833_03335 [Prolixibacteraceae bacterium]|nr:hypothetical protein [Prolixibacteraceae bacterium]
MKTSIFTFIIFILAGLFTACNEETIEIPQEFNALYPNKYFDSEIFSGHDSIIYGRWKIFDISGGFHGSGYEINFDYLVIKKIGIYGYIRNDSLLEYGKMVAVPQFPVQPSLLVNFEKDAYSYSFLGVGEKYVHFGGNDTLHLYSPCCDGYNYHFKRVK